MLAPWTGKVKIQVKQGVPLMMPARQEAPATLALAPWLLRLVQYSGQLTVVYWTQATIISNQHLVMPTG